MVGIAKHKSTIANGGVRSVLGGVKPQCAWFLNIAQTKGRLRIRVHEIIRRPSGDLARDHPSRDKSTTANHQAVGSSQPDLGHSRSTTWPASRGKSRGWVLAYLLVISLVSIPQHGLEALGQFTEVHWPIGNAILSCKKSFHVTIGNFLKPTLQRQSLLPPQ